jgi:hypothetical protein
MWIGPGWHGGRPPAHRKDSPRGTTLDSLARGSNRAAWQRHGDGSGSGSGAIFNQNRCLAHFFGPALQIPLNRQQPQEANRETTPKACLRFRMINHLGVVLLGHPFELLVRVQA